MEVIKYLPPIFFEIVFFLGIKTETEKCYQKKMFFLFSYLNKQASYIWVLFA